MEELEDKVFLNCTGNITWLEGTMGDLLPDNQGLGLGRRVLDPRGVYKCSWEQKEGVTYILQVYYRSACLLSLWVGTDGASGCENFLDGVGGEDRDGPISFLNKLGFLLGWYEPASRALRAGENLTQEERAVGAL